MDPSDVRTLRKATLKKRKAKVALTMEEPFVVQAITAPELEVALTELQEATPPTTSKHS